MQQEPDTKTVIIADDHTAVRAGLGQIIDSQPGWTVTGLAEDGQALLELMKKAPADVVIADMKMPNMDGITAGKHIREQYPETWLIAHLTNDTDQIFLALLAAGYDGIIMKRASETDIFSVMHMVVNGEYGFCKAAGQRVKKLIENGNFNLKLRRVKRRFKAKEVLVFRYTAKGYTSKETGKLMGLSERTIEDYRSILREKLNAAGTPDMIWLGLEAGLGDLEGEV